MMDSNKRAYFADVPVTPELLTVLFREEAEDRGAGCESWHPRGWACTRKENHDGPHIAGFDGQIGAACAWLSHDPELDMDEGL